MKTPAVMEEEIHVTGDPRGPEAPITSGTRENAKTAVTKLINTTKKSRALALRRAIGRTNKLEIKGSSQTNHDENSDNNYASTSPSFLSCSIFNKAPTSLVPYFL
jgi:hypothetical protein